MFTFLNWYIQLSPKVGMRLFISASVFLLLLPWGVAQWRDRHGALPRKRRAAVWAALFGAAGTFVVGLFVIGFIVGMLIFTFAHPNSHQYGTQTWPPPDDMAVGLILSLATPLDCLVSAMVYRAIRWKRVVVDDNHAPPA